MADTDARQRRMVYDTLSLTRIGPDGLNMSGSVVLDPEQYKGRFHQDAVDDIMTDPMCWTLPKVSMAAEAPTRDEETFWISVKRMSTGKNYSLDMPVVATRLDACMRVYAGRAPFDTMKITAKDKAEIQRGINVGSSTVYEESRTICGERFTVRAMRAPHNRDNERADVAVVYMVTPDITTTLGGLDAVTDRAPLMKHCAAVTLLRNSGFRWTRAAPAGGGAGAATDPAEAAAENILTFRFGDAADPNMVTRVELSGTFEISQREDQTGAVSIPMTLRQARFLRHGLTDGVNYHIKAYGTKSYMVSLKGLAGWEVYIQVNMHGTLNDVRNWFNGAYVMAGPYIQAPYPRKRSYEPGVRAMACERDIRLAGNAKNTLAGILIGEYGHGPDPAFWTPPMLAAIGLRGDGLFAYLGWAGATELETALIEDRGALKKATVAWEGNLALRHLLAAVRSERKATEAADRSTQALVLRTMFRACLGAAQEAGALAEERLATGDIRDAVPATLAGIYSNILLRTDDFMGRSIERNRAELLLESCLDVAPGMWWDRGMSVMRTSLDEGADALCCGLIKHSRQWAGLFPDAVFGPDIADWKATVETAAGLDMEVSDGMSARDDMLNRARLEAKIAASTGDTTVFITIFEYAAAFCMLTGDQASVGAFVLNPAGA